MSQDVSGFLRVLELLAEAAKARYAETGQQTTIWLAGAASHAIEGTLSRRTEDLDFLCKGQVLRAAVDSPPVHADQLALSAVVTPGWERRADFRPELSTHALRVWIQDPHDRLVHKILRSEQRDLDDFLEIARADRRFALSTLWQRAWDAARSTRLPALEPNVRQAVRRLRRATSPRPASTAR